MKTYLATALLFAIAIATSGLALHTALAASDVVLLSSSVSPAVISTGQSATFTATLGGNSTGQKILLDLELYDSTGQQVAQTFLDKITLPAHKNATLGLTAPASLPPGTYYFSVGVFTPGWGELTHWYHAVKSLTVTGTDTPHILLVRIDRPKTNLANGSTATIAPTLINTGPTIANATVTVSLWRGGNFIDDEVYTNQTLAQNIEKTFPFTTIPLMQGSYTIKTQVKTADGTILQNFPDLGLIAVNP